MTQLYFYGNQQQSFLFENWSDVQQKMRGDKDRYYKKMPKNVAEKFKKLYDKVIIQDWKKYAFTFDNKNIYIYTDGSAIDLKKVFPQAYRKKEFIAGYGVYSPKFNIRVSELFSDIGKGTINQAELYAIIDALKSPEITKSKSKKVIFTDSIYSYHQILFYKFFKDNKLLPAHVENEDLISLASHLVRKHKVALIKIMSHTDEDIKNKKKLEKLSKTYGNSIEFYKIHIEGNKVADNLALSSTRDTLETIKKQLRNYNQ